MGRLFKMATAKGQRIGIWVIIVFMVVGTIGSFAIIALQNKNQATDTARQADLQAEHQANLAKHAEKLQTIFTNLFGDSAPYQERVAEFDANSVTELASEDLKAGEGAEIKEGGSFKAFYIGWGPDGKIFDSSFENNKVKTSPFDTSVGVIDGWKQGAVGMREGGVRLLTIPSALAYGETGSGESIPPNTPLKFILFVVPSDTELPEEPQMSDELYQSLMRQYGQGQ